MFDVCRTIRFGLRKSNVRVAEGRCIGVPGRNVIMTKDCAQRFWYATTATPENRGRSIGVARSVAVSFWEPRLIRGLDGDAMGVAPVLW